MKSLVLANTWQRTDDYQRALYTSFRPLWAIGDATIAWTAQTAASFSLNYMIHPRSTK